MLTITGFGAVPLLADGGLVQLENDLVGESLRAFAGNLRSSARAEKRRWQARTAWLSEAQELALRAVVGRGKFVACTINGTNVTCEVWITESAYRGFAAGFVREVALSLQEV